MNTHKPTTTKGRRNTQSLIWVLLALQVLVIGSVGILFFSTRGVDYAFEYNTKNITNELKELRFCYNNAIQPCDDSAVGQWNEAHPDDSFTRVPLR